MEHNNNNGFTLLELMIIIVILGVISALLTGNFVTSLKKGRDARKKQDLEQIQKALEMYYEDNRAYPASGSITFGSGAQLCHLAGCGTKIYMQSVPDDPLSPASHYRYCVDTTDYAKYQLYTRIENTNDPKIITPTELSSCTADCSTDGCNYGISSQNTSP